MRPPKWAQALCPVSLAKREKLTAISRAAMTLMPAAAIDAEVVIGEPAHGGGKANGELRRRDGEPSGKLRLVGEGAGDPCGPAYRGKAERESPENSQRDADVRVPLGEKQGERGGCEGQMDQNHG